MCVIYLKFELYILYYIVSLAVVYSSYYRGKEGWGGRGRMKRKGSEGKREKGGRRDELKEGERGDEWRVDGGDCLTCKHIACWT